MRETMKPRARDLKIQFGQLQPGPLNAITDVPGVRVGHSDVRGRTAGGRDINTGVTLIEPRAGSTTEQPCFAGVHILNGNGDATGLEWIREAGLLTSPIAFTNTHSVGVVRDALIALDRQNQPADGRQGLVRAGVAQRLTQHHPQLQLIVQRAGVSRCLEALSTGQEAQVVAKVVDRLAVGQRMRLERGKGPAKQSLVQAREHMGRRHEAPHIPAGGLNPVQLVQAAIAK